MPVLAAHTPRDSPRPGSTVRAVQQPVLLQYLPRAPRRYLDLPTRRAAGLIHEHADHHDPPLRCGDLERPGDTIPAPEPHFP